MNKCFFAVKKLKTGKQLSDAYAHDLRLVEPKNADPLFRDDNVILAGDPNVSFEEYSRSAMDDLIRAGVEHTYERSDSVRGLEIMLTFSRDRQDIDLEEWCRSNIEWIRDNFDPSGHKAHFVSGGEEKEVDIDNLKLAVLHMDESNPHIHAFVVPVTERGTLSAKEYIGGIDGRQKLIALQDSYAEKMGKEFGLERGEKNTVATHVEQKRYYAYLKEAVSASLPEPEKGESAEHYKGRADEVYRTALSHHRDEIVKKDDELVRERSVNRTSHIEMKKENTRLTIEHDRIAAALGVPDIGSDLIDRIKEERERYERAMKEHREEMEELERRYEEITSERSISRDAPDQSVIYR